MPDYNEILALVKDGVRKVLPDASVMLFGSRAYGTPTEESDWDFFILTSKHVTRGLKNEIHDALFPISIQIGAFINTLIVQENDWVNNPSYYSLQQTTKGMVQI